MVNSNVSPSSGRCCNLLIFCCLMNHSVISMTIIQKKPIASWLKKQKKGEPLSSSPTLNVLTIFHLPGYSIYKLCLCQYHLNPYAPFYKQLPVQFRVGSL